MPIVTVEKRIFPNRIKKTSLNVYLVRDKGETAVHGCHCPGDMVVHMRTVLAIPRGWYVCLSADKCWYPTTLLERINRMLH